MRLIETVRVAVHQECGPTVSCADILALSAREAIYFTGTEPVVMPWPLGRLDSVAPATFREASILPPPTTEEAAVILDAFAQRGYFKARDVVALLGGHSLGKAHCPSFNDRFWRARDAFTQDLSLRCSRDVYWVQPLDDSPDVLDTAYFINVKNGKGVLTYETALMKNPETAAEIRFYVANPEQFVRDFSIQMGRLINIQGTPGRREIRKFGCFRTNAAGSFGAHDQPASA